MRSSKSLLLACSLLMALFALSVDAQEKKKIENPLVGNWQSEEGIKVQIRDNGTLTINGEEFAYKVKKTVITIVGEEGAATMPFVLDGDTLTVEFQGQEITYSRVKAGAKNAGAAKTYTGEGIIQAFVGKWCYLASMTGNNSYSSSRCFILNANGTYTYSFENSTSGAYGGTNSQGGDSGRWTATRTTLTAYSNTNGKIVYPIELRNHPKNGDPMIIVDGDAYITSYQKPSW